MFLPIGDVMSHNPILADKRLRRWAKRVRGPRIRFVNAGPPVYNEPLPYDEVELEATIAAPPLARTPVQVQVVSRRTPGKPPQRLPGAFLPPRDREAEEAEARRLLHDLEHNPLSPDEVKPRPNDGYVPVGDMTAWTVIEVINLIEAEMVPKEMLVKLARVVLSEMRKYEDD
jgi:hypothetical protein